MQEPVIQELEQLQGHLAHVKALAEASAVLGWDQQTYMPPGGAEARAAQLTALASVIHEKATGDESARLLAAAERAGGGLDPDSDGAALLRAARRDFDQATKVPTALVAETARVTALAF